MEDDALRTPKDWTRARAEVAEGRWNNFAVKTCRDGQEDVISLPREKKNPPNHLSTTEDEQDGSTIAIFQSVVHGGEECQNRGECKIGERVQDHARVRPAALQRLEDAPCSSSLVHSLYCGV